MEPVILENFAWPEISRLRDESGGLLILPMGATEQHGPHLPVGMDTLLVEEVCKAASARTGVPVMSALRYTVSQGHTPKWPGTFSLRHGTFISVLRELAAWAVATGWKRLLLVNSHFGNDAPARVAVDQIRLEYMGRLQIGLAHAFQTGEGVWAAYTSDADDLHANRAETSLMMHLFPELVKMDRLAESDDEDRTGGTVFSYPVAQTSLNGVTGNPSQATAEEGELLFGKMVEGLVALLEKAKTEEPPLPKDEWEALPGVKYD
ncbi:MAG: creatininase family protein [Akkermansiaceae bacterium]|nr:creatininase family protein [Akkermansiaceae bacterium]MDP4647329.1 creatininase family protein [Akkermansiaceae bacterium]MDP4720158.1 creatininase family protein [Akkermansiaceae bacterium]MDP4779481.1 creatininase family protein [Akkermansiaceae bacterium]MDP4847299.1 creatininase family protein [Akkermansiaceae bacterium]